MAFEEKRVAVLIPAFNEATQIGGVIKSVPSFVDHVVVVNDGSTDTTAKEVRSMSDIDDRVELIDLAEKIEWEQMYARYRQPDDLLILANVADCRVADVPMTPIYGVGEQSWMRMPKVNAELTVKLPIRSTPRRPNADEVA